MFSCSEQSGYVEHTRFLSKILSGDRDSKELERYINVVNRMILNLSTIDRMTVFVGQGTISLFYLNVGLAHDYRFIAEDTVFENLNADIGLITKGSGYFLPRLLGVRKATEVLQWKSFSAEDALQLGLVDRIVPASKLEEETLQFVRQNLVRSSSTLLGIRKLLKCDTRELQRSLELEDHLIKDRLNSAEFRKTFFDLREK
jgi:2-(1,2-epoxy-1,2-dihydrophenyl)acetyl-CoA isomerase